MRFINAAMIAVLCVFFAGCGGSQAVRKQTPVVSALSAEAPAAVTVTAVPVAAATATVSTEQKAAETTSKPRDKFRVRQLIVNSDTMNFNKDTLEAVFRGNVEAQASNVIIKSDMLVSKDYKTSAQASGNVRAFYKEQGVEIECGRLDYKDKMSLVYAYDNVTARKTLKNGDVVVLRSEELTFNAADNILRAKKIKKRVRITMKDIIAFCDEVSYNDGTRELFMTGNPLVKKSKSVMLAESVMMNVDKKSMSLKQNIWTKMFYRDFETARTEAKIETDKNTASDKDVQQKAGSK